MLAEAKKEVATVAAKSGSGARVMTFVVDLADRDET